MITSVCNLAKRLQETGHFAWQIELAKILYVIMRSSMSEGGLGVITPTFVSDTRCGWWKGRRAGGEGGEVEALWSFNSYAHKNTHSVWGTPWKRRELATGERVRIFRRCSHPLMGLSLIILVYAMLVNLYFPCNCPGVWLFRVTRPWYCQHSQRSPYNVRYQNKMKIQKRKRVRKRDRDWKGEERNTESNGRQGKLARRGNTNRNSEWGNSEARERERDRMKLIERENQASPNKWGKLSPATLK